MSTNILNINKKLAKIFFEYKRTDWWILCF